MRQIRTHHLFQSIGEKINARWLSVEASCQLPGPHLPSVAGSSAHLVQ